VPVTQLVGFLRRASGAAGAAGPAAPAPGADTATDPPPAARPAPATAREREGALRRECAALARRCDGWIRGREPGWAFGETNRRAKAALGRPVDACGEAELRDRLAWLKAFFRDEVRRRGAEVA